MAVALDGFSIRDYASKMRSINVEKSWPFGVNSKEKMSNKEIAAKLPPMKCPKYRWWKDSLKAVRSNSSTNEVFDNEDRTKKILEDTEKVSIQKAEPVLVTEDEEKLMMRCPVCLSFTAMTVNAVNAHIDSCLAQTTPKVEQRRPQIRKSRTRKRRSIVEIFAVSPQIEVVDSYNRHEVFDFEDDFNLKVLRKASDVVVRKQKREKNCEAVAMMKVKLKKMKMKKKMKKKKKKKMKKIDGGFIVPASRTVAGTVALPSEVMMKVRIHTKFKVPSAVDFFAQQKVSLHDKSSRKDILDASASHKKRPSRVKSLYTQKKVKFVRASKFLAKQQQHFPGHSSLKSCAEVTFSQNKSAISSLQGVDQINGCQVEQTDKHVRFSIHDELFGPTKIQYSSAELPQVQSHSKELSFVMDASPVRDSMESERELPAVEVAVEMEGSNGDVSTGIANEIFSQSTHENTCLDNVHCHLSALPITSPDDKSSQDKETCADRSVDVNQVSNDDFILFRQGNSNESQTLSYASFHKLESTPREGFEPNSETRTDWNVQSVPNTGRHFAEPVAMTLLENANESLHPSTSCSAISEETNGRYQLQSQAFQENSSDCDFLYQSLCHMSSKELMTSICSSVEWKEERESVYSDKCVLDSFIGLPLNSQGEFIQLHSGGKGGFKLVKPTADMGSATDFRLLDLVQPNNSVSFPDMKDKNYAEEALPNVNSKFFPRQNQQENTESYLSSQLGITELHGTERAEVYWQDLVKRNSHSVHQLASDINVTDISFQRCRQYDQTQNQTERERIQSQNNSDCMFSHASRPTMRLMGKDVTVGVNNTEFQGLFNGRTCTDKETVTGHRFSTRVSDDPSLKRQFRQECIVLPLSEKSKETIPSLEAQRNPSLGGTFATKTADLGFSHSYLNWQTYVKQQNSLPLIRANASAKLHSFLHPLPSQTFLNETSNCQQPSYSRTESLKMTSQLPVVASTSPSASQHVHLNSSLFNCNQRLPHGIKSAFLFPLPSQECQPNSETSWPQSSSQRLPQWLLNAPQQKEAPLTSSWPYSGANADLSCSISGTNFSGTSIYDTSMVAYPQHPNTFHSKKQSQTGPVPFFNPTLIPARRGCKPTTIVNASRRNKIGDKDGEKSKHFHCQVPDSVKTAKKRPADKADGSAKEMKKPNLMQGDPSAAKELNNRINITGYTQCNTRAADVFRDEVRDFGHSLPEIQKTGHRDSSNSSDYAQCNTGTDDFAIRDRARDVGHSLPEIQRAGFRASSCFNSFRQDGLVRAGPIKLSAGAKHILKPNKNMDQDQPMPTHSTIPFGAVTNSEKISEFQKSAQIYRF